MGKSEEYRRKEREAARAAQAMGPHPQRDQLLAIAKAWKELAERAEATEAREREES